RCTFVCFSFTGPASTEISTLSLHDALPISRFATGALARRAHTNLHVHSRRRSRRARPLDVDASTGCAAMTPTSRTLAAVASHPRSEEHTSELQSRRDLVCRLLLEKKKSNVRRYTRPASTPGAKFMLPASPMVSNWTPCAPCCGSRSLQRSVRSRWEALTPIHGRRL